MSKGDGEGGSAYPKSVQAGIPKLSNPAGWPVVRIGDIFKVVQRPVDLQDDAEYQLVTAKRNRGGVVPRERLTGKSILTKSQFRIAAGDFLISRRQIAHGACGIVPEELAGAIVSNEYATLLPTDLLEPGFMRHLPESIYFQQTCFHSSIGVHVEKLVFNLEDWLRWPIAIPCVAEQKRITEILDTWNYAAALGHKLAVAMQYRFRAVLARMIDPILSGNDVVRDLFATASSGAWGEEGMPGLRILRNTDFGPDGFLALDAAPPRILSDRDRVRIELKQGDIVLEKSGGGPDQPVGRVSRFVGAEGYGFSNFLLRLSPKGSNNSLFCYFILERMYRRRDPLCFQQQTTGIRNLEWQDYLDLPISIPHREKQDSLSDMLRALELAMHQASKNVALLERQKRGLLPKLLTGEWPVPESIDRLMPGGDAAATLAREASAA